MDLASQGVRLLHLAGFGTGIALYAMLGMMVLQASRAPGSRKDRIPLSTAVLGVLWNAGALALYGLRDLGLTRGLAPPALLVLGTIAFSALGFLPAVVVHAAMLSAETRVRRGLTTVGYALSSIACILHVWGVLTTGAVPTPMALQLLTVGYALVIPVLAFVLRQQPGGRGLLTAAALALFAMMTFHLSHHVAVQEGSGAGLWGHHASIPLALVILYQDFRFALADLFLKRALAAVLLVGVGLVIQLKVIVPVVLPRLQTDPADPLATTMLLGVWAIAGLAAWPIRRVVWTFVDRVVLRRSDYAALRERIAREISINDTAEGVLGAVRDQIASAFGAQEVAWQERGEETLASAGAEGAIRLVHRGSAAIAEVPTAERPRFELVVDGLPAGRRLLSDDVGLLDQVVSAAARRIDALRVAHERYEREAREQEILRLATEAELRALRAQLNPHFLFNALTTIGYLIEAAPARALSTLYRLTELLRAVLRPGAGELQPVSDELEIIDAYLAIEHARFEERLRVRIDVSDEARAALLPPLLLQPLVENAVKHGISPLRMGGDVLIRGRVEQDVDGEVRLHLSVTDTGAGASPDVVARRRAEGVGLNSVARRIARQFGTAARLEMRTAPGEGTVVDLWCPVAYSPPSPAAPLVDEPGAHDVSLEGPLSSSRATVIR